MPRRERTLAEIGEIGLLHRLQRILDPAPRGTLGMGDDTAVLPPAEARQLLTTDSLVEGTHFQRDWFRPEEVGAKAVAVNLSDVAAMGGEPEAALVSLVLPVDLPVRSVERLTRGIRAASRKHKVPVLGGNVARGDSISVTVTVLGSLAGDEPVLRSGARPGDRLFVSGQPGLARLGLLLVRGPEPAVRPDLWDPPASREPAWRTRLAKEHPGARRALGRFLTPDPRLQLARALRSLGPTSMIDVSDGLGADLANLARAGARLMIDPGRWPRGPLFRKLARSLDLDEDGVLWGGGEDYELLFTLSPEAAAGVRRRKLPVPVREIGEVAEGSPGVFVQEHGRERRLRLSGFDHFVPRG